MNKLRKMLCLSVLFVFLGSLTILFMPLSSGVPNVTNNVSVYITGFLFWMFFIIGYGLLFYTGKKIKKKKTNHKKRRKALPGIFVFFSNKPATIFDLFSAVLFLLFIILLIAEVSNYFPYVILTLLVFSFNMHCILNGKIYRAIKNENGREKNYV